MPSKEHLSPVTVQVLAVSAGPRHPESVWTLELRLHNQAAEPRWFAFSGTLDGPIDQIRGAPGVRLEALPAAGGEVPLVRLMSGYELLALLLPPGGRLHLRKAALNCWNEKGCDTLEVWSATALRVSDVDIAKGWLKGHSLLAPAHAEVAELSGRLILKHMTPELKSEPISLAVVERWRLQLDRNKGKIALPWEGVRPPPGTPGD